jgi:hypothetical protein
MSDMRPNAAQGGPMKPIKVLPIGSPFPYRLAVDGIVGYSDTDMPDVVAVWMSRGSGPVLVRGTVAELDRAYSSAAVCEVPEPTGEQQ